MLDKAKILDHIDIHQKFINYFIQALYDKKGFWGFGVLGFLNFANCLYESIDS